MFIILERGTDGILREVGQARDAVDASLWTTEWLFRIGAELPDGRAIDPLQDNVLLRPLPVPAIDLPPGTRSAFGVYILRDERVIDAQAVIVEKWVLVPGGAKPRRRSTPATKLRRVRAPR